MQAASWQQKQDRLRCAVLLERRPSRESEDRRRTRLTRRWTSSSRQTAERRRVLRLLSQYLHSLEDESDDMLRYAQEWTTRLGPKEEKQRQRFSTTCSDCSQLPTAPAHHADALELQLDILQHLRLRLPGLHAGSESVGIVESNKYGTTHLIRLAQCYQLVAEQLSHLRILDDASQRPGQEVRVSSVARVERHRERRRSSSSVEMGRRLGQMRRLEVVANGESVGTGG